MNNIVNRLLFIGLILFAILAPFAGLAPLMLLLLVLSVGWAAISLLQVLIFGQTHRDDPEIP